MTPEPDLEWVEPEEFEPARDPLATRRTINERYAVALATADAEALCELFVPDGAISNGVGPDAAGHDGLREMAAYGRERYEGARSRSDRGSIPSLLLDRPHPEPAPRSRADWITSR